MITNYEDFKKILPLDSISSVLIENWTSPFSGILYTKGQYALIVFNREMDQYKIRKDLEEEAKRKRAAAAAKAWSASQSADSSRAELSTIKAASAASKALEEIKAKRGAAASKAWSQDQAVTSPTAQVTEIYAQMDREKPDNAVYIAESTPEEVKNEIRDEAREAQEKSMQDEQNQVLPEVQVKSDFGKYLLIGGGVLLAYYLLTKKGRKE